MKARNHKKRSTLIRQVMLVGAALVLEAGCVLHCPAQTTQQFTGHVTDLSGAVIPDTEVVIHNEDTGVDTKTTTTKQGAYTVPYLKPGKYDITVTKQGFRSEQKTGIALATDQTSTIDFQMAIGAVQEVVSVNASGLQVELSKADRSELIEAERVQQLPIDSRNAYNLVGLSPGVHDFSNPQYGRQFDNVTGNQYANGSPQVSQTSLDGVGNDSGDVGRTAYTPSADAIQEFKVVINAYDASYGHSGGSAVDVTLKSGTNKYHGAVDWFGRRTWLNGGQWQNLYNGAAQARAPQKRDNENYELDGPVRIPHLFNGRDKLFFFGNYEQLHDILPNPGYNTYSIPDPAWLTGDFSSAQYFNTTTNSLQPLIIYDPLSPLVSVVDPRDGKTKLAHSAFPGNRIPQNRLDPTAAKIAAFYNQVSPNVNPGAGFAPFTNNYENLQTENDLWRNAILKIDWILSDADRFTFRWGAQGRRVTANSNTGFANSNLANQNGHGAQPSTETGQVQWTHIFSPRMIFDFNSSLMTYGNNLILGPRVQGLTASLGFASNYVNQLGNTTTFPGISPSATDSKSTAFAQLGESSGLGYSGNTHALNFLPTLTVIHGAHTMRAGVNVNFDQWDNPKGGNNDTFNFSTQFTNQFYQSPDAPGYVSGSSIASLVLGYPVSGSAVWNVHSFFSQRYFAPWFQDDWKISQKLTLNLGVRWDFQTPRVERFNKMIGAFDPSVVNPVSAQIPTGTAALGAATQLQGGLTFAGVNGQARGAYKINKTDVQPRIGFAYAINPRMSLRGGIGENYIKDTSNNGSDGFGSTTNYTPSLDNNLTPYTATTGLGYSAPIPTVQVPSGASRGYLQDIGKGFSYYNRNYRIPAIWSYSVTYEVAPTRHDVLSVSYVGSRVPNNPVSDNINHVSPQWNAQCDVERGGNRQLCEGSAGQVANPFLGVAPFAGSSYYLPTVISKGAFTRPFPEFGDITQNGATNNGKTWYNSFQAVASHQVSNSLVVHATYTHAKDETSGGIIDPVNRVFSRQVSTTNDVKHSITLSDVVYLPFGRGRQFFSNVPRVVDVAINGWEVSSVYSYYSGFAWRPTDSGGSGTPFYDNAANWEMPDGSPISKSMGVTQTILPPDASHKFSRIRGVTPCVGYRDPDTGSIIPSPAATAANCSSIQFVRAASSQVNDAFGHPTNYAIGRRNIDFGVRQPGGYKFDATLSKNFRLPELSRFNLGQGANLQLRIDAINAFNHANWDEGFINDPTSPDFGTIQKGPTGPTNLPRIIQLGARFSF